MENNDPLGLVLPLSRIAGLAPYDTTQHLRVSRPALLYSYLLHVTFGIITLSMHVAATIDMNTHKTGYSDVFWFANVVFLDIFLLGTVITSPKKFRYARFLLTRAKKICRDIKYNPTTDAAQGKWPWIFMFMGITVSALLNVVAKLLNPNSNKESEILIVGVIFFDMKCIFLVLLAMQFVFMATKINSAMRGIIKSLEQLNRDLSANGNLEKNNENYLGVPKEIISGVQFINVKSKMVATFDYDSAAATLRSLACAYVSTCYLVRKLGNAAGGFLFLLVTFSIVNLLQGIYFTILTSDTLNVTDLSSVCMFIKAGIYCGLHFSTVVMLIVPGHDLSEQLENACFLVSHMSCEASSSSNAFQAELNVFFIHLKVNQPHYSALGMCTLGRPLLLTVIAFVVTYLAVLLGF